jgi:hypothetical protein
MDLSVTLRFERHNLILNERMEDARSSRVARCVGEVCLTHFCVGIGGAIYHLVLHALDAFVEAALLAAQVLLLSSQLACLMLGRAYGLPQPLHAP